MAVRRRWRTPCAEPKCLHTPGEGGLQPPAPVRTVRHPPVPRTYREFVRGARTTVYLTASAQSRGYRRLGVGWSGANARRLPVRGDGDRERHGRARKVSVEPNAEMVERARGQLGLDCASNATVVERALNANRLGHLLDATQQTAGCPSTTASASRTRSCATRAALAPSRLAELPLSVHSGRLTLDLRDARNLAVATLPPIARCAARNSPRGCSDLALLVPGGRGVAPRIAPSNADGVAVGGVAGPARSLLVAAKARVRAPAWAGARQWGAA